MTKYSKDKLEFAKTRVVPLLESVPSLRQVGVYGSVAQGKARPDSDIDLIVVCQDGCLHLCRFQVNWRLWQAGLRGKVSVGVVVCESALKPETFQYDNKDQYANRWFNSIKWIYFSGKTSQVAGRNLNWLIKQFFWLRFKLDQLKKYPNPHIKFSDQVFFHFGDSRAHRHGNDTE